MSKTKFLFSDELFAQVYLDFLPLLFALIFLRCCF